MNIAIIFAGGTGQRLSSGENSIPKQFLKINDKPIIIHTLELFEKHKDIALALRLPVISASPATASTATAVK